MSRCYTSSRSSGKRKCRGPTRRNIAIAVAILAVFLLPASIRFLSASPLPTFTIANDYWDATNRLYGGSVSGYQDVVIPDTIVPSSFPTQVVSMTGAMLEINPDRLSTTPVAYYYGWTPPNTNLNGPLPDVVMEISSVVPADSEGNVQSVASPSKQWDDGGVTWYTYYFLFSTVAKTKASTACYTDTYVYSRSGGERLTPTETQPVDFKMWIEIHLQSTASNSSFMSKPAGATIVKVNNFLNPKDVDRTKTPIFSGDTPDDHWFVGNNLDVGAKISTYLVQGSDTNKNFVYEVSGTLDPGLIYTRGGWQERTGIDTVVNCGIEYGVLVGVTVSTPLNVSPVTQWYIVVVDYIISQAQDPSSPGFWVLLGIIAIVLYLLFRPRGKDKQSLAVHIGTQVQKMRRKSGGTNNV